MSLLPAALAGLLLCAWLVGRRPAEWLWGALGAVVLAGGFLLGWAFPSVSPAAPAIGQAVAVPLISLGISLRLFAEARRSLAERAAIATRPSPEPTAFPLHVLASMSQLATASNLGDFADHLVRAMAWATRSEIALLVTPPDDAGQFIVANGYDLMRPPTCVDHRARCADACANRVSKLFNKMKILRTLQAPPARYDDVRLRNVRPPDAHLEFLHLCQQDPRAQTQPLPARPKQCRLAVLQ